MLGTSERNVREMSQKMLGTCKRNVMDLKEDYEGHVRGMLVNSEGELKGFLRGNLQYNSQWPARGSCSTFNTHAKSTNPLPLQWVSRSFLFLSLTFLPEGVIVRF